MPYKRSRRAFLRLAGAGALGVLLGACQPKVVEVTREVEKVVKETVLVKEEAQAAAPAAKEVRFLVASWALGEVPFDRTAREFNDAHPDVKVSVQSTFEGWQTKVTAQINAGTLEWSGAGILSTDLDPAPWIKGGLVQPMDDLIAGSTEPGADTLLSDMIPTIRNACTFEGKVYSIPYSFENCTFNWRTDYCGAVGATAPPADWDEWLRLAVALKEWGADQKIYGTAFSGDMNTDLDTMLRMATDQPYTADGIIDWTGAAMMDVLAFMRRLILEEEVTPPHGKDGVTEAYFGGKVATFHAQSSRGVWGQNAFGTDIVVTSPTIRQQKGGGVGACYWCNNLAVLNKAPYPQEACDYLIYTMGPQNIDFQKTVIKTGKTPIYTSIYDNVIEGDPQFGIYKWMIDMRADVETAPLIPQNTYVMIEYTAFDKWWPLFTDPGSTMSPEEFGNSMLEDIQAEIAKQKL